MFDMKKRTIKKNEAGRLTVFILFTVIALCLTGCSGAGRIFSAFGLNNKVVGKNIREDKFQEFYYTYSTTVNPPEFQRYRFFVEGGKPFFYHEKREGDNTFLTEEDITVSGTKELTEDEWKTFWSLIDGGTVHNRIENVNAGNGGPWLYLYWDGDKGKCQEFSFKEYERISDFEAYCESLISD